MTKLIYETPDQRWSIQYCLSEDEWKSLFDVAGIYYICTKESGLMGWSVYRTEERLDACFFWLVSKGIISSGDANMFLNSLDQKS